MSAPDPRPWIPTASDLWGGEIDYATEEALRCQIRASQYERGTPEAESALRMSKVMRDYVAQLRDEGPFDAALDYQRLRGGSDSAEDGRAR